MDGVVMSDYCGFDLDRSKPWLTRRTKTGTATEILAWCECGCRFWQMETIYNKHAATHIDDLHHDLIKNDGLGEWSKHGWR